MGSKNPKESRDASYVAIFASILLSALFIIPAIFLKPYFIYFFTVGDAMALKFSNIFDIYIYIFNIFNTLQAILGSILRAIGE